MMDAHLGISLFSVYQTSVSFHLRGHGAEDDRDLQFKHASRVRLGSSSAPSDDMMGLGGWDVNGMIESSDSNEGRY
jgi:hypothetical protein